MFSVIAVDHEGLNERVVYRTADAENCTTYAESHFIRNHSHMVKAVTRSGFVLTNKDGRPYVWERNSR